MKHNYETIGFANQILDTAGNLAMDSINYIKNPNKYGLIKIFQKHKNFKEPENNKKHQSHIIIGIKRELINKSDNINVNIDIDGDDIYGL